MDAMFRRREMIGNNESSPRTIYLTEVVEWENGTYNGNTGSTYTALKNDSADYYDIRQRTAEPVDVSGSDWILTANWSEYANLKIFIMRYDNQVLSESRNMTKQVDYPINDADYITCVVAKTDDSQVTYQDVLNLNPRLIEVNGDWDYKWKYTDGLPSTADGWSTTTSGTGSFTLKSNCLETKCNNSSYRFYGKSTSATIGVLEAVVNAPSSSTTGSPRAFVRFGNSTTALYVYFTYNSGRKIKITTASTFASGTNIGTWDYNFYYTLRLEINNGIGAVYLDNQLVKSNIDMSTCQWPGNIRFGIQNASGLTSQWKSIKYRIGRI